MASERVPGCRRGPARPEDLRDGTRCLDASTRPGPLGRDGPLALGDGLRRLDDVREAWALATSRYAADAIAEQLGEDFSALIGGIVAGLGLAVGGLAATTAVGAAVGGAAGSLAGGIGAVPGAAAGAKLGLSIGVAILGWLGLAFLVEFLAGHVGAMGDRLGSGMARAWDACGDRAVIEAAAREIAEGIALFFSLLVQAIIVYLSHRGVGKEGAAAALERLRQSLLFRRCRGLEAWLVANFPRLRARFVKLRWEILEEGPRIAGTSIPEWIRIKVGRREFQVFRNKDKLGPDGQPIGPALKHLGEHSARNAGPWAKASEVDFPISSLASALDQAEAQLLFRAADARARPLKLENWELLIDTTQPVWRVFHASYTSTPRW